jgi:TolB-like protein/Flp pilus assembly protein TadD
MPEPGVQRKLAAILAADVAGYSRLMGNDEVGTAKALRGHVDALRPIIGSHGGRIIDTAGDGVLLEFPSIVAAVECAVAAQKLMAERNADVPEDRRMLYRIGINLGDVIVDGDRIVGDGVNVAARLESIAPPGGICLSDDAYRQVRGKVAVDFADIGERRLKNIAEPVRVYVIASATVTVSAPAATASPNRAPRLSIVVLPFANLSRDPEQDYFVDGITESLTTDLSRISGAFVIARNTAFTYKGKPVDVRQIGRELGVRYVMEGSVQSGRDRIRINAQLVDTGTGAHLWAERFDKPRADLFDMQDEITARLARIVGVELVSAEARRVERERPHSIDAIDLTMRGRAIWAPSVAGAREAQKLYEAALQHDDRNVEALIGLASTHLTEVISFLSDKPAEHIGVAEAAISKALMLAPEHARAHFQRGMLLRASRVPEQALREFELALRLDPNLVDAHAQIGLMKVFLGRAAETEAAVAEAMRLSPRDPSLAAWYVSIGAADLYLDRLDQAVDRLRKSIEISPSTEVTYFFLAGALALAGRDNEAAQASAAGLRLSPSFTVAKFRRGAGSDNPVYLAQRERLYAAMRKAGVPEE